MRMIMSARTAADRAQAPPAARTAPLLEIAQPGNGQHPTPRGAPATCAPLCVIAVIATLVISARVAAQQAANPLPLINQPLVPEAKALGGAGFKLTVNGTGFVSGSLVHWNGRARTTHFVNASQLTATVFATDIATAGTASVTVVNPSPGGTSNVRFFEVTDATLAVGLDRTDYAVGASPTSVTTEDFNGDGKLDLAVVNSAGTVSVLLGNGDGTFQPQVTYTAGGGARDVTAGDFNGDGKLDLAVTNLGSDTVSIFLGNGDGTFQGQEQYPTSSGPWGLTAADLNGDGKLDLAVTNNNTGTVSILLGNGDGTFQAHVDYTTGSNPESVAVGDFDGDGKLDLAVTNRTSNTISILLGTGDGTFSSSGSLATGPLPRWVTTADLNGDGYLDLAEVTDYPSPPTVAIFLGNGNGTFQPSVTYPIAADGTSVVSGDFNGDGKLDLATSNFNGGSGNTVSILLGNGDGTFQPHMDYSTAPGPNQLIAGDFNDDGRLDLAVAGDGAAAVSVLSQATSVSVLPAALQFGAQVVGASSAPQTVTLTDTGYLPLDISSIAVTGADVPDFGQTNTCGSSLAVGASCTISVTFTPAQAGPLTAAVTITDNAAGSPQSVSLSGTGVTTGPNVTLSPTSLTFATQLVGTSSSAQPVTLSNYGSATLTITSIKVTGADRNEFGETSTCHRALAQGASCTINVIFSPSQRGPRTAGLSITDNASGSPQTVSLSGTGTVVSLNPTSLNFGVVVPGSYKTLTTTLTNAGSGALSVSRIRITGSSSFYQTNTCGSSVAPGASCTVTVTFSPPAPPPSTFTATVSISDNGGASPQTVALSGVNCLGRGCPAVDAASGGTGVGDLLPWRAIGGGLFLFLGLAAFPAAFRRVRRTSAPGKGSTAMLATFPRTTV